MIAREIGLWCKEKLGAMGSAIFRGLKSAWRWLLGLLGTVSNNTWRKVAVVIPFILLLYILIGMVVENRVDDTVNPEYETPHGGSKAVSAMVYLVKREAQDHNWLPNDPIFLPGWWLDNTPNYQRGIISALSRFGFELRDQLGRIRGSSAEDDLLVKAAGNLAKEPDRWVIDFSTSLLPTTASDTYYREAIKDLKTYNQKVAAGEAVFDQRSDNLLSTLDRIALDLGASSAALEDYIGNNSGGFLPDFGVDDLFYQTKGQVYAYLLVLTALQEDFSAVITDRQLADLYGELLKSLTDAATLDPLIVTNGAKDGVLANHLSMQGFYLLRARTQLRELTNILRQ